MVADAVGHHFDEDGLAAVFEGEDARLFGRAAHGEDVVAVDAEGGDAVACAARRDAVAPVLVAGGRRDGVAVVAAEEDAGDLAGGGDVEGCVEVAFRGGAFAKVAHRHSLLLVGVLQVLHLEGVGGARGVRDLGREGRADGVDVELLGAVVDGHVAAEAVVFGVGEELVHEHGECKAALQVYAGFAVLAEGDVGGVEGAGGANGYALFAGRDLDEGIRADLKRRRGMFGGMYHVETQSALPLCFEHEKVHNAHYVSSVVCRSV